MKSLLCITVRFLQPYFHGRGEDGDPEWPPSPLRLLQALVAASAGRWNERTTLQQAAPTIRSLEMLSPPQIIAVPAIPTSNPYRLYVPDNVADKVAGSWCKGRDATIADYRAEKDVRPVGIEGEAVHYLYALPADSSWRDSVNILYLAARSVTHLGWGIDMAVGDASIISTEDAAKLEGVRWYPSPSGGTSLRVPRQGTLNDLIRKHRDFLGRLTPEGFRPVPPLRVFDVVHYRRQDELLSRPYRVFELRSTDGSRFRYPHRKLIHIAGMVRHLAIEAMRKDPPRGLDDAAEWLESYVAGHQPSEERERGAAHRQLSYLPLPSVGHEHTDPGVRRVMISAPLGDNDERWLDHIARRLAGQLLKPEPGKPDPFAGREPPLLVPMPLQTRDGVVRCYTGPATVWHSITPVILPGHDDHKPAKTRKLIEKALTQSGVDQPCEFEWSAFSRFRKSYTAHKYNRQKEPQGYFRPDHLSSQTAVHLTVRFGRREVPGDPTSRWIAAEPQVPGPFVIGAGRHCGLGLLVAELETKNTSEHNGRSL